ncbi:MAG: Activator of Hsp90 ATPase 1 family protein [Bacteroidetes bacterium]|nr:MAG: Activator of Hsp90 ATPase 1 family protein [Bacteroidota bacterium]
MAKTICQTIQFKNVSPETLYGIYTDPKKHSKAIGGAKVKIAAKAGSSYSSWDGYITGKTLQLIKGKMIVQSWRSSDFKPADLDSTLILWFEKKGKDAVLNMVHANVPDHQYYGVKGGWDSFYWKPWKKFLSGK